MSMLDAKFHRLAERYIRFAVEEARGSSDVYERLALGAAASPEILGFIASLPADRQQPNLFLGAVRHLCGIPQSVANLEAIVRESAQSIRDVMLTRTTQTNEPARCSVLLPLLASLPQPLALIEVGASAGLCLLPDRYGYDYGLCRLEPMTGDSTPYPVFPCSINGDVPLPSAPPTIGWRAGLDLNPVDLDMQDQVAWLENLVWPGQEQRAARLHMAIEIARAHPPLLVRGDLLSDLEPLMANAPKFATLVVFHTAVLGYVPEKAQRDRFARIMMDSRAVWISNESPRVFAKMAERAPPPPAAGCFLLAINGEPIAWTGPHGQSLDWFASHTDG
jgi:hypothetical protein